MSYKGFVGSVEYDGKDSVFYGKIEGIDSLVNYEGCNLHELYIAFCNAVDEYIDLITER